ncbi:SRPBCC family protein [Singulisphaera sp. PoT]|uniref:SRPBCC family protein n=1 Tax=Singulisphaera sp. PoT TaxID=3411797 RepID=UPI003BF49BF2
MSKKTLLKRALLVFAVLFVAFIGLVAMQPSEFEVDRSATIAAPASLAYGLVNDFHKWEGWSPWSKRDPSARKTFEGSPTGTGAVYHWDGNAEVGEGIATITESKPSELIKIRLEFIKPFAGTNFAEFRFKDEGGETLVTWSIKGRCNFIAKGLHLFLDMDKMIGGDFESGLREIKYLAELEKENDKSLTKAEDIKAER